MQHMDLENNTDSLGRQRILRAHTQVVRQDSQSTSSSITSSKMLALSGQWRRRLSQGEREKIRKRRVPWTSFPTEARTHRERLEQVHVAKELRGGRALQTTATQNNSLSPSTQFETQTLVAQVSGPTHQPSRKLSLCTNPKDRLRQNIGAIASLSIASLNPMWKHFVWWMSPDGLRHG